MRSLALALGLASVTLAVTSCSATGTSDAGPSSAPASGSATPAAPTVRTRTTLRTVAGTLSHHHQVELRAAVTDAVDGWIDAAYLGRYPRSDFADAFSTFTPGAAHRARHDRGLLTNAGVGADVTAVSATQRRLRLDVLAVKGRPVGVTAAFSLGFDVSGGATPHERVTGSLFLTHEQATGAHPGRWRIFGYDVDRGAL